MKTQTEMENQEVLIEDLKNQMPIWTPTGPHAEPLYIATSTYRDIFHNEQSDGIKFVSLDDETIVYRETGDSRDTGDWQLVSVEEFRQIVVNDAEATLSIWQSIEEDYEHDNLMAEMFS